MKGNGVSTEQQKLVGYSDADFAADKTDRKSITGGYIEVAGMPVYGLLANKGGSPSLLWKQISLRHRLWSQR